MAEPLSAKAKPVEEALATGALDDASRLLQRAMVGAPETPEITDAATVAELLFYQGLVPRMMGAERNEDLDHWRDALVVFPDLVWKKNIYDDRDQQAVFEALRGEVGQRPAVATGVPAARGTALMYVDGVSHAPDQAVRAGRHLVQVACPDGEVVGRWTRFEEPVPWLSLCSTPVDTSVAPPPPPEEDEFAFGMDDNSRAGPDPLPISAVFVPPPQTFSERWKKKLLLGAGGSAALSGGLYVTALISRAKYDAVDETELQSQAELDSLRRRTNTQVGLSMTFAGAGVGMATVAAFSGRW